jgi:hypothetical protein
MSLGPAMNGRDVVLRSKIEIATWVFEQCPVNDATLQRMIRINDELVDLCNWPKDCREETAPGGTSWNRQSASGERVAVRQGFYQAVQCS